MNSSKAREHQHIAKLVRAFVSPSTPPEALAEVVLALQSSVTSPNDILGCETIPESHFLKQEALIVRDAFEAATNGMTAPDAFIALESLPATSVWSPWKALIGAILAFYQADRGRIETELAKIPPASYPARLKGLMGALLARQSSNQPLMPRALREADPFMERLFPDSDSLSVIAEEIGEALREGMIELCMASCARLLRELRQRSEACARAAALLILAQIEENAAPADDFLNVMGGLFGEAEALRITALYLSDSRPLLALLVWAKAGARALEESSSELDIAAWALVIDQAASRARSTLEDGYGFPPEFLAALEPELGRFFRAARILSPEIGPALGLSTPKAAIGSSPGLSSLSSLAARYKPAAKAPAQERGRKRLKSQLELFA